MIHPCRNCKYETFDKNGPQCIQCQKRIDYIRNIENSSGIDCKIVTHAQIKKKVVKVNRSCINCHKNEVYAKGKCRSCYNADLRRKKRALDHETPCKICGKIGVRAMGMCHYHYTKDVEYRRKNGLMKPTSRKRCKIENCNRLTVAHGLCEPHYQKHKRKFLRHVNIRKLYRDKLKHYAENNGMTMQRVIENFIEMDLS